MSEQTIQWLFGALGVGMSYLVISNFRADTQIQVLRNAVETGLQQLSEENKEIKQKLDLFMKKEMDILWEVVGRRKPQQ